MKYAQSTDTTGNYYNTNAQPLDAKGHFIDLTDMADVSGNDPLSYYEEMIARDSSTGKRYRWIESVVGVISGGYTYPAVYEHDGVDYGGKTYNFVEVGEPIVTFTETDTFPPTENYPKGTVAMKGIDTGGTITVTAAATADGTLAFTANGVAFTVGVLNGDTIADVTDKIQIACDANAIFDDYTVTDDDTDTVTFAKSAVGAENIIFVFTSADGTGVTVDLVNLITVCQIHKKTDNLSPGTWQKLFEYAEAFTDTYIETVIIAMFAGSGGLYGTADTPARSDHDHLGLLYRGELTSSDNLDSLIIHGHWSVDGADLPTNFPVEANIGYPPANGVYDVKVVLFPPGSGSNEVYMEVSDEEGPVCYRTGLLEMSWDAWERFEATDAEVIAGTAVNKYVSPAGLSAQGAWVDISTDLTNGWTGSLDYRVLNSGVVEVKGDLDASAADNAITTGISFPPPDTAVNAPVAFSDGTDTYAGFFQIDTSGNSVVITEIGGAFVPRDPAVGGTATFIVHFMYST